MLTFLKVKETAEYEMVPDKLVAFDKLGFRWYRKGLNNTKDKWFFSCAILEWYGRAHSKVDTNILEMTREHDERLHIDYVLHKQSKFSKFKVSYHPFLLEKAEKKNNKQFTKAKDKENKFKEVKIPDSKDIYVTSKRGREFEKIGENIQSIKQWILSNKQYNPYLEETKSEWIFKIAKKDSEEKLIDKPKIEIQFPMPPDIRDARIVNILDNNEISDWQLEIDHIKKKLVEIWQNEAKIHKSLVKFMSDYDPSELTKDQKEVLINLKDISDVDPIFEVNLLSKKLNSINSEMLNLSRSSITINTAADYLNDNDSWDSTYDNTHQI